MFSLRTGQLTSYMIKHPLISSLVILCLVAPLNAPFADSALTSEIAESKPVSHIDIIMENLPPGTSFDPKAILSRLKTKIGDPFSQAIFDLDLKTLANDYDRIEPNIQILNNQTYITIKLWPRPQIRTIRWHGNSYIKTKKLQKELGVKPGNTFNREGFNKAFNKVKELYIKQGYFESELNYHLEYDSKTNEVDVIVDVDEGRSGKIEEIEFIGFSSDERSEILKMIHTKRYNLFTSWFTGHGIYNEDAAEQDNLTIVNFLQNKGYADAKVNIQVLEGKKDGKIILKLTADKGAIYHFDKISFEGNTLFTDEQIKAVFLVHPKQTYSPEEIRNTVQAITDLYGRKGHIDASVQYEAELVEDKPLYNVHFRIEEGEQYKVGLIRIFGNIRTQDKVILRESNLVPGEVFDTAKLKATQARLENMGYFQSVNVYAVRTSEEESLGNNYRDVYIEVKEGMTGNVSLFFGFSTSESVFAGLDLAETNFNYKGIPYIFRDGLSALRGGGEYFHARANFGTKQRVYSLSWTTPYVNDSLWRLGFDISKSNSRLISKNYDTDTYGLSVFASYPLNNYWTYGNKYRIRDEQVHVSKKAVVTEQKEASTSGVVSGLSVSLNYDSTFTFGKPRQGLKSYGEFEVVGLGGRYMFTKYTFANTYYSSLWSRGIMKYRLDFRFILPIKPPSQIAAHIDRRVPLSERFFLGGETTVRGYHPFSLGPRYKGNVGMHEKGDPKGGVSSSLISLEYLQIITSFLDAFVFADAGSVELNRFSMHHFNLSCGYGIRLDLLNKMPIMIGMGYPINPDSSKQVQRFFFSMGGQF